MDVALADVDEVRLTELVRAATTDAAADEVTPPLTTDGAWTPERTAWLRSSHRDRWVGLGGPAGEATWAVVLSGALVGAARLRCTADPGVADTGLWLTRSARGTGVGRAVLLAVLELAAAAGIREVRAETTTANTAALAVLRRLGFTVAEPDDDGRVGAVVAPGRPGRRGDGSGADGAVDRPRPTAGPRPASVKLGGHPWSAARVLELSRGLSAADLAALAELERSAIAADGGRLKLEWGVLRSRSGERVEDLLWWEAGQLLGFLGLYQFGSAPLELAGAVEPAARRRGIGTALLDAATGLGVERGLSEGLLVVPESSAAGRAFATHRGGTPEHSEHALVLEGAPSAGPEDPRTTVRRAGPADVAQIGRLLEMAFGHPPRELRSQLAQPDERTLLVAVGGAAVGTVRLTQVGDTGGVYGFAVDPAWQGRGIGRDVLRRVCTQLFAEGAARVGLEVAVDNDRALGLYTSLGFVAVAGEDYYAVPLA